MTLGVVLAGEMLCPKSANQAAGSQRNAGANAYSEEFGARSHQRTNDLFEELLSRRSMYSWRVFPRWLVLQPRKQIFRPHRSITRTVKRLNTSSGGSNPTF